MQTPDVAERVRGACVLELGAGTGLAGCSAFAIGATDVVITDLPYAMAGLEWAARSVARAAAHSSSPEVADCLAMTLPADPAPINAGSATSPETIDSARGTPEGLPRCGAVHVCGRSVQWAVLDWEAGNCAEMLAETCGRSPDLVLLADVVWVERLVEPLLATLDAALPVESGAVAGAAPSSAIEAKPIVLMAHQTRALAIDALLFEGLRLRGFTATLVHRPASSKIGIWQLSRGEC